MPKDKNQSPAPAMLRMKQGREYRLSVDLSSVPQAGAEDNAYRVRGTAVVFDRPTCLFESDGVKFYEVVDRHAFDECDLSDVIFNYNHGGKVVARLRNKTLYEEIKGGYIDRMSFSFVVREASYDNATHTRKITKIKKLYDVSAVDIPAYEETNISARSFFEEEHSKEVKALEQAQRRKRIVAYISTFTRPTNTNKEEKENV